MTIKITLITPPDIFENSNDGIFLINLSEYDQTAATDWLRTFESDDNLNIYFLQNDAETPWILHAIGASTYKYIDINNTDSASKLLTSYILSKNDVYYSTSDPDAQAVYSHINPNRVSGVKEFFERTLGAEKRQSSL